MEALIAKVHAKRLAAGLVVSFDRDTPEETAACGRATRAYASAAERDAGLARLTLRGRNPRIEN